MGFGDVLSRFQTPLDTGGYVARYHAAAAYPRRRPAFVVVPELMLPRRIRLPAQQLRHASPSRRLTALDSDRVHLVIRHRHGTTLPPRTWDHPSATSMGPPSPIRASNRDAGRSARWCQSVGFRRVRGGPATGGACTARGCGRWPLG